MIVLYSYPELFGVADNNGYIVRQCRRASYHQTCTGIAGSRGVRFSSSTEQDVGD
jgi:hypothetical protein